MEEKMIFDGDMGHGGSSSMNFCMNRGSATVYPKKYAHGFVVLCFVVVM